MKTNYLLLQVVSLLLVIASTFVNASPSVSVAFVLDESGSISATNFELETEGFQEALDSLSTDGSIEVSILGFSGSVETLIEREILTSSTYNSINSALENNTQASGGTYMSAAIDTASNILQGSSAPTRIICMATDGYPNSESATITAADNAKAAGIILTPIGIALDTDGKSFLDGIASNPPVPNPTDFEEFAEVVVNVCVTGLVDATSKVSFNPAVSDFGNFAQESWESLSEEREAVLRNDGITNINITDIFLSGDNASYFSLEKIFSLDPNDIIFPVYLRPGASVPVTIAVKQQTLNDKVDGDVVSATIIAKGVDQDGNEVEASGDISITVSSVELRVNIIDASAGGRLIADVNSNANLKSDGGQLSENDINNFAYITQYERLGFVADGNSRLLIRIQTNVENASVTINLSDDIDSNFEYLDRSISGSTTLTLTGDKVVEVENDLYQTTSILIAPENFPGEFGEEKFYVILNIDIKDEFGSTVATSSRNLTVQRAPVLLVHGLWANPSSFMKHPVYSDPDGDTGLYEYLLEEAGFSVVEVVDYCLNRSKECKEQRTYPNHLGPEDRFAGVEGERWMKTRIDYVCYQFHFQNISCTKSDIVGHSMGGLMTRYFVSLDEQYYTDSNFHQGAIRRLVTLSTPHSGSGLANLLTTDDEEIGSCLNDDKTTYKVPVGLDLSGIVYHEYNKTGSEIVKELIIPSLEKFGNKVDSAIDNLRLGEINKFLADLNANQELGLGVPIFVYYGDVGNESLYIDLKAIAGNWLGTLLTQEVDLLLENLTGCKISDLFNQENSDGIVPVSSSKWTNYIPISGSYIEMVAHEHTGMGTENFIVESVAQRLTSDIDTFFVK